MCLLVSSMHASFTIGETLYLNTHTKFFIYKTGNEDDTKVTLFQAETPFGDQILDI